MAGDKPKNKITQKFDLEGFGSTFKAILSGEIKSKDTNKSSLVALVQAAKNVLEQHGHAIPEKIVGHWIKETSLGLSDVASDMGVVGIPVVARNAFLEELPPKILAAAKDKLLEQYKPKIVKSPKANFVKV